MGMYICMSTNIHTQESLLHGASIIIIQKSMSKCRNELSMAGLMKVIPDHVNSGTVHYVLRGPWNELQILAWLILRITESHYSWGEGEISTYQ